MAFRLGPVHPLSVSFLISLSSFHRIENAFAGLFALTTQVVSLQDGLAS